MDQRRGLARRDNVLQRDQRFEHPIVRGIDVIRMATDLHAPPRQGRGIGRIRTHHAEMGQRAAQAALGDAPRRPWAPTAARHRRVRPGQPIRRS
jgi:hypothetical protein